MTSYQTGSKKAALDRKEIDILTGKTKQQLLTEKSVLTKYKIDPLTGKTIHQMSMDKASATMRNTVNVDTGKTISSISKNLLFYKYIKN